MDQYRVNVIGFVGDSKTETNVNIEQNKMLKKFSIDKNGSIYRIEYYTKNTDKFAGMVLIEFTG